MGRPEPTAGEVLAAVVADLAARVDTGLPAALADEPDAVHRLRTSVRRLRNVLAAFSAYLEPGSAGGVRAGLAEYGDRLARARDAEVRTEWCRRAAAEAGLDERVTSALVGPLRAAHDDAHRDLVAWTGSAEAARVRAALLAWAEAPALSDGSARPASVVAREVLAAQVERVLAHRASYRADEEEAHALRKAARRLRHTADAVTRPPAEVLGKRAARAGELGARIQSLLGDHRDALLLVDHVRRSAPAAADGPVGGEGGAGSSYAPLVDAAERLAASAIDAVPPVLDQLAELAGPADRRAAVRRP